MLKPDGKSCFFIVQNQKRGLVIPLLSIPAVGIGKRKKTCDHLRSRSVTVMPVSRFVGMLCLDYPVVPRNEVG